MLAQLVPIFLDVDKGRRDEDPQDPFGSATPGHDRHVCGHTTVCHGGSSAWPGGAISTALHPSRGDVSVACRSLRGQSPSLPPSPRSSSSQERAGRRNLLSRVSACWCLTGLWKSQRQAMGQPTAAVVPLDELQDGQIALESSWTRDDAKIIGGGLGLNRPWALSG